jgi:hypothetical protein
MSYSTEHSKKHIPCGTTVALILNYDSFQLLHISAIILEMDLIFTIPKTAFICVQAVSCVYYFTVSVYCSVL